MQTADQFGYTEAKNVIIHFVKVLIVTLIIVGLQQLETQTSSKYEFLIPFLTAAVTAFQEFKKGL